MPNYPYNPEIHEKAKKILETKAYEGDCLKAGICPKCGGKLDVDKDELFLMKLTCQDCHTIYYD